MFVPDISVVAALLNISVFVFVTLPTAFRAIRERRMAIRIRNNVAAYEQELRERGVQLPTRCVACWQLLPRHVRDCHMRDFYEECDRFMEWMTRPPITVSPPQPRKKIIVERSDEKPRRSTGT